jgi:predicted Holliday junction resolvase-like endonuclease
LVYLEYNLNRMAQSHQDLINFLQQNGFKANCPTCGEGIKIKDSSLFSLDNFNAQAKQLLNKKKEELKIQREDISKKKVSTQKRVETTTGSVNVGFILERLAPVLEHFPFDKNDCRSLFDPIDYVIFEGLQKTGKVQKIFFVDIKSGKAKLKPNQKAIKQMIEQKKVEFKNY